jgi:peptide/nickel transport system substrate-binding protein
MIKSKKLSLFMLMILVVTIALYGCGGKKNDAEEEKTPTSEVSSTSPVNGGKIVVGISQDLDSLDPHKAVAAGTKEVLFNVFEGLVKPDKDGNLVPAVAEKYELSADGKVYTFHLRPDVKFHNGKTVTADDVIYSLKRSAGLLESTDPAVVVESALTNVSEVNKIDEATVEVVLKEADSELIGYLTCAIIPKDYTKQDTAPVGTGPFKFVSYTPLESFVVEKNEDYYGTAPYLDQVTFKIVPNPDSAMVDLMAGSIDIYPYLTDTQAEQVKDTFRVEEGHMNLVQALFLNSKAEPFNNAKVRQALSYALDRQGILDMVAGGRGTIIGSNMFPGFAKYYSPELAEYYTTDIEKAKSLLAEAGYPNGFTFTITVPSNYKFHVDTAQVLVEQLKQIGVTAEIKQVEWASWLSDVYVGRNYDATVIGLDAKLAPRDVMERYGSKSENNFLNYSNPKYDEVLAKALKTTKDDEKITYYKELQKILTEDAASLYIQDPALLVAVNKKLEGYTFYPVYVLDMSSVYFTE